MPSGRGPGRPARGRRRQSPWPRLHLRLGQGAKPALFTKEETEAQRAMISTFSLHALRRTLKMGDPRDVAAEGGRGARSAPGSAPGVPLILTFHFALTLTFTLLD